MMNSNRSGFTLIETVVVIAIIGVLAAVLTPVIGNYVNEARVTRASQEAQTIADAILDFNKNTGKWPIYQSGATLTTTFQTLQSPGVDPGCAGCSGTWLPSTASLRGDLGDILERNLPSGAGTEYGTTGKFAWRGPYMTGVAADPWGNRYIVNASSLSPGQSKAVFVLSAGPDATIQTTFSQNIGSGAPAVTVGGDDVVARVR